MAVNIQDYCFVRNLRKNRAEKFEQRVNLKKDSKFIYTLIAVAE
jgi:hypothetical protein